MRRSRAKKFFLEHGGRFLPFLFTFGNAFFGFCSLILAVEGEKIAAAYCIFVSALMDALDGRVARMMKVESDLGLELDSLCDAISFCLAPAYLTYVWYLRDFGFVGAFVAGLFLLAGLFRLARFNLLHSEQDVFFIGLPTTIAGCFVVTVLLGLQGKSVPYSAVGLLILLGMLAWLMVSSVRFPTFKKRVFRIRKHTKKAVAIVLFAVMAIMRFQTALLVFFLSYFVFSVGHKFYFSEYTERNRDESIS
jgi:CDP-diacylglycerol--serine O-phosphatidyltransferase